MSSRQTTRPVNPFIIPDQTKEHRGRKTLVLDLDETLIHAETEPIKQPDIQFSVTDPINIRLKLKGNFSISL